MPPPWQQPRGRLERGWLQTVLPKGLPLGPPLLYLPYVPALPALQFMTQTWHTDLILSPRLGHKAKRLASQRALHTNPGMIQSSAEVKNASGPRFGRHSNRVPQLYASPQPFRKYRPPKTRFSRAQ